MRGRRNIEFKTLAKKIKQLVKLLDFPEFFSSQFFPHGCQNNWHLDKTP
jgi:hypothetical protein